MLLGSGVRSSVPGEDPGGESGPQHFRGSWAAVVHGTRAPGADPGALSVLIVECGSHAIEPFLEEAVHLQELYRKPGLRLPDDIRPQSGSRSRTRLVRR